MTNAKVLWFTGLSGSGKTTIADGVKELLENRGKKVKVIDGDDVRKTLHKHLGFTPEDIKENNRLISNLCKEAQPSYDYVVVPIISPFKESRKKVRQLFGEDFVEVFIKASLDECKKRDTKGLYEKALKGEIPNFIGIAKENPYEAPEHPEITLDTETESVEESISKILHFIHEED